MLFSFALDTFLDLAFFLLLIEPFYIEFLITQAIF
jgi:hypothetical protein